MALTLARKLLIVALGCVAVAWASGPAGRLGVACTLLLFGPGYLIERALPAGQPPAVFVRPALWLGLSLSAVALLYQWVTALGLALTPPALTALAALVALAVTWAAWYDTGDRETRDRETRRPGDRESGDADGAVPSPVSLSPVSLSFAIILGLTLWTRVSQIEGLALPPWVDPVHHGLMVRVAAEQGRAPISLRPYLPVDDMPYHWGYHVFTAAVMQLSGVTLPQVLLWQGQLLNAIHVLPAAALASYSWRRPFAGLAAAVVVGLVSIFPAFYVSWGRYTQLSGLLILPPLAIAWHAWLRAPARRWQILGALLLAGLSLVHFRVLLLTLALMAVSAGIWAVGQPLAALRRRLAGAALIGGAALLLTAPWLAVLARQALLPAVAEPQRLVGGGNYNALSGALLWAGQNRLLIALALLAALWGLWRRARPALEQVAWVGAMVVLANPWLAGYLLPASGALLALWALRSRRLLLVPLALALLLVNPALVRLPYLALITNEVVVISLFLPLGVLIGGAAAALTAETGRQETGDGRRETRSSYSAIMGSIVVRRWLPYAVLLLVALWGAWSLRSVVNPTTVFATPADLEAIEWAAAHTPPDARFLINATDWLDDVRRSTDGGWWLLPLAGRWTSLPPVLYTYGSPAYVRAVGTLNDEIIGLQPGQREPLYRLIRREGITHVYLGAQGGTLTADFFAGSPLFTTVYQRDGVTILEVRPVVTQGQAEGK